MTRLLLSLLLLPAMAQEPSNDAPAASPATAASNDAPAGETGAVTYTVANSGTDVYVVVYKDPSTAFSGQAHDHVLYASKVMGTITWPQGDDPSGCSVKVDVPVADLVVDPPGFRAKAGIDPDDTISDSQKSKVKDNMWGASQLDRAKHPNVTFVADRCEKKGDRIAVTGDFTLRGVTQRITVPMQVEASPTGFRARGGFETSHTAFGFKPYSAFLGAVRNQDKLTFSLTFKATPQG